MTLFARLLRDKAGATAIEYGLIAALIAIGIIAVLQGMGNQLESSFRATSSAVANA